ncbi:MAG: hypothetical protein ACI8QI_000076 [Limisphaerales bacterium]|jgi:hypothetical protein
MSDISPPTLKAAPGGLEPHRGTLILVLGILSLTMCSIFTGIPAWIMGRGDLKKIGAGVMDPEGGGMSKAGMICGIISTILGILCVGFYGIILIVTILSEVSN